MPPDGRLGCTPSPGSRSLDAALGLLSAAPAHKQVALCAAPVGRLRASAEQLGHPACRATFSAIKEQVRRIGALGPKSTDPEQSKRASARHAGLVTAFSWASLHRQGASVTDLAESLGG